MSELQLPSAVGGYITDWVKKDVSPVWLHIEESLSSCLLRNVLFIKEKRMPFKEWCSYLITRARRITQPVEGGSGFTTSTLVHWWPLTLQLSQTQVSNAEHLMEFLLEVILVMSRWVISLQETCHRQLTRKSHKLRNEGFILKGTLPRVSSIIVWRTAQILWVLALIKTWERQMGAVIREWEGMWGNGRKMTVCNWTGALQLKMLHRAPVDPNCTSKSRKDVSPLFKM